MTPDHELPCIREQLLKRGKCVALPALLSLVSNEVIGQGAATVEDDAPALEEVLVLGSHIPRADYRSISPVFTISRDDIAIDSRDTVAELLNRYPQFVGDRNGSFNDFGVRAGAAPINLRGLGANRNLTLLNGRRLGPGSALGQVDTHILPMGLVERVEVLTGGAAAVYGSDAMSGVTNFTLRDDVEGLEVNASFERTDRNDGDIGNLSVLAGRELGSGWGHITGFASHLDAEAIGRAERDISALPLCEDRTRGELYVCGSPVVPAGYHRFPALLDGAVADDGFTFDASGNPIPFNHPGDLYNPFPDWDLRPGFRRSAAGAALELRPGDDTRLNAVLLWSEYELEKFYEPAPAIVEPLFTNLDNPVLSPAAAEVLRTNFDPRGAGVAVFDYYYVLTALGRRKQESVRDNTWLNLELEGQWLRDWRWIAAYTLTDFSADTTQTGGYSAARLQQALLVNPATGDCLNPTGGCTPADIFGPGRLSAEAAAFIREGKFVSREDTRQQVVSLLTNGTVSLGQQRDLAIATGFEWREDQTRYRPDPALTDSIREGFNRELPVSGDNSVTELYAEMLLPLFKERDWAEALELEVGARYSDYSNADEEWTWKSGLSWMPAPGLRFRGMYQRAARAPNIVENYSPTRESLNTVLGIFSNDPCAASRRPQDFPGRVERCIAQGIDPDKLPAYEPGQRTFVTIVNSANPDLDSETADTYTLGLVWTPGRVPGFSVTLDAYRIDIEGAITYVPPEAMFQLCFASKNPDRYCAGIERDPGGDVTRKFGTFLNIGAIETRGYDLSLSYLYPHRAPWGWGSEVGLSVVANRTESFEIVGEDGGRWECAGKFGGRCTVGHEGPLPKHSALTRLHYRSGPLTGTLSWRWIDGARLAPALIGAPANPNEIIPVTSLASEHYLDFNLAWEWRPSFTLSFSVLNLTDTAPPELGQPATQANTDPGTYDVLGRRYRLALTARF